jgi:hypothetical protein
MRHGVVRMERREVETMAKGGDQELFIGRGTREKGISEEGGGRGGRVHK